jgi:serine O-acetyltransferase
MSATASPLELMRADITASREVDTEGGSTRSLTTLGKVLLTTRLQAVILFRIAQALHRVFPPLATVAKYVNMVVTGADIATAAAIGPGLQLFHPAGVVIGPECVAGARCTIM